MTQLPDDLFQQIITVLMELPAKHVYSILKRVDNEAMKVDNLAPDKTGLAPDVG